MILMIVQARGAVRQSAKAGVERSKEGDMRTFRNLFCVAAPAILVALAASPADAVDGREYILIVDRKSSGTGGGSFSCAGNYQTRALTSLEADDTGLVGLANNQVTLPAGTYEARIRAPSVNQASSKARLRNVTAGTTTLVGTSTYSGSLSQEATVQVDSWVVGQFTIASQADFEVQQKCTGDGNTYGAIEFGYPASYGEDEIYTTVELYRVTSAATVALSEWVTLIGVCAIFASTFWMRRMRQAT